MISEKEFELLLKRNEGATLDFKQDHYDFSKTDGRNMFIKDIISMANTPRQETAHIVLGVQWTAEHGSKLVGLSVQADDAEFTRQLGTDRVSPVPHIWYAPIQFRNMQFGVIGIPVDKYGPFLPTKTFGEILREGQMYVRRSSQNVAADSGDIRKVTAWFHASGETPPPPEVRDTWVCFLDAVHHFESGRRYLLVTDRPSMADMSSLAGLGLVPWSGALDFDPRSEELGLLAGIETELSRHRSVLRSVKGQRMMLNPNIGTLWFFTRGLAGREDTIQDGSYRDWIREYGQELDEQVRRLASVIIPSPVTVVVLWNSPELVRQLTSALDAITKFFGDAAELLVVTQDDAALGQVCTTYGAQALRLSLGSLSAGLADHFKTYQSADQGRCAIPTHPGAPRNLDATDRLWLEEDLEIVHLDMGNEGTDVPEPFRKGATVSWRDLNLRHDCDRDITDRLLRRVDDELRRRRIVRINLFHAPGAGGTTVARRVVWELHRRIPCVLLHRCDPRSTAERLAKLAALAEQAILLLIDGGEHSERQIDDLYDVVAGQQTPVVMLQVLRRFVPRTVAGREFFLPTELTPVEADRFCVAYSVANPPKTTRLKWLASNGDVRQRTAFYFGLEAFGRDFEGLSRYVETRLRGLSSVQAKILGFLAIAHHYAQQPLPCQVFAELLKLPRNRKVDFSKALSLDALDLVIEVVPGMWRITHDLVAEEIIKQLLWPQATNRDALWRQQLSQWCIDFAYLTRGDWQTASEQMLELACRTFVYRDNAELLGTERSAQRQYSQIIEDIPSTEGKLAVLRTLAEVYPEEAHFHAHLGRFCGLNERYEEGVMSIDRAIALEGRDPLLHHMRGMILRYQINDLIGANAALKGVLDLAKSACESFRVAREINPQNEHGYISEVQLLLRVLDYAARGSSNVQPYLLSSDADPFLRESFERAEQLLDQVASSRGGNRPSHYEEDCRARLHLLYGDPAAALQGWENLLSRKDAVKPPIRRQIVWTLLVRRGLKWDEMEPREGTRCVKLLEENLAEAPHDVASLRLWLRAVRHAPYPPNMDSMIERVSYWKANTNSLDAAFYLYVLHTLVGLSGSVIARADAERVLEDCRNMARFLKNRTRSFEWLGKGEGIGQLVHHSQLGQWVDDFWERRDLLARVSGRIASIDAPQKGTIELSTGQTVFFVPAVADFHSHRDENIKVELFLGFSYEGPRAWQVTSAE